MDALVLSVVASESTYGYKITQDVRSVMEVSESTLYPVLRRLQKDGAVEFYDLPYQGRNRRYYRLTDRGRALCSGYRVQWSDFRGRIDRLILAEGPLETEDDHDKA